MTITATLTAQYVGQPIDKNRIAQIMGFVSEEEIEKYIAQASVFDLDSFPEVERERESLVDKARAELDRKAAKMGMKPIPDKTWTAYGTHGRPAHPIEHWFQRKYL